MTAKLSGPMLPPASGQMPRQLVVLLHGYGADGNDLIDLGRYWQQGLPEALFVSPNAPMPCERMAQGYQWFPVEGDLPIRRVAAERPVNSAAVLRAFLGELWAQTGLSARDTFLVGFSQGAMMALHVGLSLDQPLLGVVSFSGALIPPEGFAEGRPARPPVCLVHGDLDQVVDPGLSRQAALALQSAGYEVSYCVSPGTAHAIAPDGLEFATGFMLAQLAAASA